MEAKGTNSKLVYYQFYISYHKADLANENIIK